VVALRGLHANNRQVSRKIVLSCLLCCVQINLIAENSPFEPADAASLLAIAERPNGIECISVTLHHVLPCVFKDHAIARLSRKWISSRSEF
jgi:hypothetical protein